MDPAPAPHVDPAACAARTAVVVVTFNRAAMLADALGALRAQTVRFGRLVVVDNASTDGTAAVLARFPEAEVVRLGDNLGASGGFAAGIAHAAAQGWDWVWTMDDDVLPAPDALERLFAAGVHVRPDTAALQALETRSDGRERPLPVGHYSVARMRYVGRPLPPGGGPVEVTYVSFLGLLVRGSVARREVPRADFFVWHDDVEYGQRLRHHGRLWLVPAAVVVHRNAEVEHGYRRVRGRRVTTAGTWRVYYGLRNRLLTNRAHGTPLERALGALWGTFYLLRSLGTTLVHYGGDRRRAALLVRGYLDGLRGRSGKRVAPGG